MLLSDFWDYYIRQEARNKNKSPPNLYLIRGKEVCRTTFQFLLGWIFINIQVIDVNVILSHLHW